MSTANTSTLDTLGIERLVVHSVDTRLRERFADLVIAGALSDRGIVPPPRGSAAYRLLRDSIAGAELPLEEGRVSNYVVAEYDKIRTTVLLRARVEDYAQLNEIPRARFTPTVRDAMITYLNQLGVQLDDDELYEDGGYDEYLAIAYAHAVQTAGGSSDPIVAARTKSSAPWDFTVKYFDEVDPRHIVRSNILAVGAIDYAWYLGDLLGVFGLAERVGDLWDNSVIDIETEELQSMIFNYRENAIHRSTPQARGLMYKRVLGRGGAKLMSGVVGNEELPRLWHQLMAEVAKYIEKREGMHEGSRISKRPIVHAIEELQYNLTDFGSGGTGKQAQKLNAQLEDAMAILSADEVVEQLAFGRRKSVWRVIERLSKEQRGRSVDVNAVRILAEEGNRVFRFIADHTPSVSEEEFESFVDSAEAWILAEVSLGGGAESDAEPEMEEMVEQEPEREVDTDSVDAGDAEDDWQ
jgi:hypothetical protein